MPKLSKDAAAGALFLATGVLFAAYAWLTLPFGTGFRMGPAFFPVIVGGLLALLGAAIMLRGLAPTVSDDAPAPWRAIIVIPVSLAAFGLMVRPLGLVLALFATCVAASFASRDMSASRALAISAGMTAVSTVLFGYMLDLSMPLIGDWLR